MPSYVIWGPDPVILRMGSIEIKWYGLCILLAFLIGRQIGRYFYKRGGRPVEEVDNFCICLVCSALFGARLGEVFFYDFSYYLSHPFEALFPFTLTPHFRFTGYQGLSYHGAILGSLLGTYIYANYSIGIRLFPPRLRWVRQKREGQSFLWLSTLLALGLMMGFLVRIGNFMNSEIVGTPTKSSHGVLFTRDVTEGIKQRSKAIEDVKVHKSNTSTDQKAYQPITIEIIFKNINLEEEAVKRFLENSVKSQLVNNDYIGQHVYETPAQPLDYTLSRADNNAYIAQINTLGIVRHPVQLYESFAYFIILLLHFFWWIKRYKSLKDGTIAGSALAACYSLRFAFEFVKDPFNVLYDGFVTLTMGHLLSFLTVVGGVTLLIYVHFVQKPKQVDSL